MKVVVLAGGLGTRLSEETAVKPKPMIEVGDRPLLWHILKHYDAHGFHEFLIALGYRGEAVKRYFIDYPLLHGNLTVHLPNGRLEPSPRDTENWIVHLVDTGIATGTGGRLKRLEPQLSDGTFLLTYGDGLSDVDLGSLLAFHRACGRVATVTAVRPPSRFGGLEIDGDLVKAFTEKPQIGEGWINGGFMVLEPEVFRYLESDATSLEMDALEAIAADGQLAAFRHTGFWQCMDTPRDKRLLESLWLQGAPWKVWA